MLFSSRDLFRNYNKNLEYFVVENPIGNVPHNVKFKYKFKNKKEQVKVNFGIMPSEYSILDASKNEIYNVFKISGVHKVKVYQKEKKLIVYLLHAFQEGWNA